MPQPPLRVTDLTPPQQQLVTTMQQLRYGCIEHLLIREGQPVLDPAQTRVLRKIRIKGANAPHPAGRVTDYALKTDVVELLEHLRVIGHGLIRSLTVVDGLPTDLVIEEAPGDDSGATGVSAFLPLDPPDAGATVHVPGRRR